MSGSRIIIADEDRLDNVHPGDILRHDFLIGSDISVEEVSAQAGVDAVALIEIMDRRRAVDANIGIRLARYFGMTKSSSSAFKLTMISKRHGALTALISTGSSAAPPRACPASLHSIRPCRAKSRHEL